MVILALWTVMVKSWRTRKYLRPYDMRMVVGVYTVVMFLLCFSPSNIPYLVALSPLCLAWENFKWTKNIVTALSTSVMSISQFSVYFYLYFSRNNNVKISVARDVGNMAMLIFTLCTAISIAAQVLTLKKSAKAG